jgi:hypothetical protein
MHRNAPNKSNHVVIFDDVFWPFRNHLLLGVVLPVMASNHTWHVPWAHNGLGGGSGGLGRALPYNGGGPGALGLERAWGGGLAPWGGALCHKRVALEASGKHLEGCTGAAWGPHEVAFSCIGVTLGCILGCIWLHLAA